MFLLLIYLLSYFVLAQKLSPTEDVYLKCSRVDETKKISSTSLLHAAPLTFLGELAHA